MEVERHHRRGFPPAAMKHRPLAVCILSVLAAAPLAAQSATAPLVRFVVGTTWNSGYGAEITLTNRGTTPYSAWSIQWDDGPTIASLWNGTHTLSGIHHTVINASWNGSLAPGATLSIGFNGANTMTNNVVNCTVNGVTAEVGYSLPSGWTTTGGGTGGGGGTGTGGGTGGGVTPPPPPPPQSEARGPFWWPEDVNGDRRIDAADTTFVSAAVGQTGAAGPNFPADVTRNGVVDAADVAAVQSRLGPLRNPSRIVGYWIEWGIYGRNYQPANTPFEKITHLNYAFAKINPDFTIAPFDSYAAIDKYYPGDTWNQPYRGAYNQLNNVYKAQHPHLKTLISVGGWTLSGLFSDAALTPTSRATFAASCVAFLRTYNFDGIDIDWEYPGGGGLASNTVRPQDGANFTLLLAKVREELDAAAAADGKSYLLTIAAPAGIDKIVNQYPNEYHRHVDWVNVMTYDFFGAWDLTRTGHHAGFSRNPSLPPSATATHYNLETAMGHYLRRGVPREKLLPGLAFYGRAWGGVPAVNQGLFQPATSVPPGTWDDWQSGATGVNDFTEIETFLATGGYTRSWDPIARAVWAYHPTRYGGHFVSYEDPQSIAVKANWLRRENLGGFMFWEITADRNEVLLNAVVDQLGGRR